LPSTILSPVFPSGRRDSGFNGRPARARR